jgi:hypothetical protein
MNPIFELVFGAFLGAVFSILTTIVIEMSRKPKLLLHIHEPTEQYFSNKPANRAKFLHIEVTNKLLPKWLRWLSRSSAQYSSGLINFYHLDGQSVFGDVMIGRWSGSPEPLSPLVIAGEKVNLENVTMTVNASHDFSTRRDIYPGETEHLDIVARFDDDDECYGWNNESYFSNPLWRNPKWKLSSNRYLIKVEIISSGEKTTGFYMLSNDVGMDSFRLEIAPDEYKKIIT